MKSALVSSVLVSIFLAAFALPPVQGQARAADDQPFTLAAQSSKQKHINACRARYRDCLKLNQIPAFECQFVYEDCLRNMV
jgi:hypothetical protein